MALLRNIALDSSNGEGFDNDSVIGSGYDDDELEAKANETEESSDSDKEETDTLPFPKDGDKVCDSDFDDQTQDNNTELLRSKDGSSWMALPPSRASRGRLQNVFKAKPALELILL